MALVDPDCFKALSPQEQLQQVFEALSDIVAGGGGGGGGAPTNATYITQTPDATLTNEQALSLLATGVMFVATGTGAVTSQDWLDQDVQTTASPTFSTLSIDNDINLSGNLNMSAGSQVLWSAGVFDTFGAGSPEGVLAASVGSTYRSTGGGASTTWYVKESGAGNVGWVAYTSTPANATFITQTPSTGLSAEQALSVLATGILKSTTATGVVSIASAGTDYLAPTGNGTFLKNVFLITRGAVNVAGTAVETSLLTGSFNGSPIITAPWFTEGTAIQITIRGTISTRAVAAGNLTFRVRSDNGTVDVVMGAAVIGGLAPSLAAETFVATAVCVFQTVGGGPGTDAVQTCGEIDYKIGTTVLQSEEFPPTTENTDTDTTVNNEIDITVEWQTADAANSLIAEQIIIESLKP